MGNFVLFVFWYSGGMCVTTGVPRHSTNSFHTDRHIHTFTQTHSLCPNSIYRNLHGICGFSRVVYSCIYTHIYIDNGVKKKYCRESENVFLFWHISLYEQDL